MYLNPEMTTEGVHIFSFRQSARPDHTILHAQVDNQKYVLTSTFDRVFFTLEGMRSLVIHFYNIFIQVKDRLQAETCTFHFDVEAEGAYRGLAESTGRHTIYKDMNSSLMASILLIAAKYAGVDLTLHTRRHHLYAQRVRENTTLEENETLDDWCASILSKQTTTKDSELESESGSDSDSYSESGSESGSYSGSYTESGSDSGSSSEVENMSASDGEDSEIESD